MNELLKLIQVLPSYGLTSSLHDGVLTISADPAWPNAVNFKDQVVVVKQVDGGFEIEYGPSHKKFWPEKFTYPGELMDELIDWLDYMKTRLVNPRNLPDVTVYQVVVDNVIYEADPPVVISPVLTEEDIIVIEDEGLGIDVWYDLRHEIYTWMADHLSSYLEYYGLSNRDLTPLAAELGKKYRERFKPKAVQTVDTPEQLETLIKAFSWDGKPDFIDTGDETKTWVPPYFNIRWLTKAGSTMWLLVEPGDNPEVKFTFATAKDRYGRSSVKYEALLGSLDNLNWQTIWDARDHAFKVDRSNV